MTTYQIRVARSGDRSGWQEFHVELEERMTVLDALFRIQRDHDPGLEFRCACRVGMCGTCGLRVNGVPRLACRTRPRTLGAGRITLEPLANLPVIRDLVVSMTPFFEQWKRVRPGLHAENPAPAELVRYADPHRGKRDCITCGLCFAACGIKTSSREYLGPAAINKAFLRLMDPRDTLKAERLAVLNEDRSGVWRCHTQFNCTDVCPKGIDLTDSIQRLKRALVRGRL